MKSIDSSTSAYSYIEQNYEIDCSGKKIKSLSGNTYNKLGNVIYSAGEQDWQSVIPETIGETLYNGMCAS